MATCVDPHSVNLASNPRNLAESFKSCPSEHALHHDVYDRFPESSCRASVMSAEDMPLDLSRTLTTGSEGWTDSGDDNDDSSATSATSHARVTRLPHFPPVLPSVNSSSSISKSLPQKLAATIAAVEGFGSAHNQQNQSKSQSPSARFRRLKSPPLPTHTQRRSLISDALCADHLSDPRYSPNRLHVSPSRQPRQLPHRVHETISGRVGRPAVGNTGFKALPWNGFDVESDVSDEEDEDDDDSGRDDASSPASHGLQRLVKRYSRLRDRRTSLWEIFDGIHSKRTQVQDLRHVKDEASLAFMTAVQAILPNNPELDHLFKDMQAAQLRCQEAEQRFDDILDELQRGEVELELEERRFYTAAVDVDSVASDDGSDSEDASQTSENSLLRGITGDRPEDIHPLFEELREASRNIQLAKELLINTQMKRKALSAGKSHLLSPDSIELLEEYGDAGKRRALELKQSGVMSQDDIETLQDYDRLERKALLDIDRFTKETMRLEKECREKRVMPRNSPFQEEGFGFNPVLKDEIHLGDVPFGRPSPRGYLKTLAHPRFPKILSNPTHLLEEFPMTAQQSLRIALSLPPGMPSRSKHVEDAAREVNIHSLLEEGGDEDKTGYINRWLLHKLHLSPMEAELLWSIFHTRLKVLNVDSWQQDVLHLWWKDQATNLPPAHVHEDRSSASIHPGVGLPSRAWSDSGMLNSVFPPQIEETIRGSSHLTRTLIDRDANEA
ncbi:hypothetical protein GGS26DRAFT_336786 [Hypomontagnella submonticulosa]|nr:hypothetical protein GGS26DRAFT_336786 [Hypomontagnella submonticulosa]